MADQIFRIKTRWSKKRELVIDFFEDITNVTSKTFDFEIDNYEHIYLISWSSNGKFVFFFKKTGPDQSIMKCDIISGEVTEIHKICSKETNED